MDFLAYVLILITIASNALGSQWYYECIFDGERHAHEIACNRYYECRGNAIAGYTIYLYKCPEGFLYNDAINTCQVGPCDFPPSPTTTLSPTNPTSTSTIITTTAEAVPETTVDFGEETTTEEDYEDPESSTTPDPAYSTQPSTIITSTSTEESSSTTRRPRDPFVCTETGTFVDSQDCNVFHDCMCDNGICQDTVRNCPPDYHFCEQFQVCAAAGYCVCEADFIV